MLPQNHNCYADHHTEKLRYYNQLFEQWEKKVFLYMFKWKNMIVNRHYRALIEKDLFCESDVLNPVSLPLIIWPWTSHWASLILSVFNSDISIMTFAIFIFPSCHVLILYTITIIVTTTISNTTNFTLPWGSHLSKFFNSVFMPCNHITPSQLSCEVSSLSYYRWRNISEWLTCQIAHGY